MSRAPLYAEIIKRLREKAPMFQRRVGGTAKFQQDADAEREGLDVEGRRHGWCRSPSRPTHPRTWASRSGSMSGSP
jgi:hypothetical protein